MNCILNLFGLYYPLLVAYNMEVSEYVHKSHNVTVFLSHPVFLAIYRSTVFAEDVDEVMKQVYTEIEKHYQMKFLEIDTNNDPAYRVSRTVSIIKSITWHGIYLSDVPT